MSKNFLFRTNINSLFDSRRESIKNSIRYETVLPSGLAQTILNRVSVGSLKITGEPEIDKHEINITPPRERMDLLPDPGELIRGIEYITTVAYVGDSSLFQYRPIIHPEAEATGDIIHAGSKLQWTFQSIDTPAEEIKQKYLFNLNTVKSYLENINKECQVFNKQLPTLIHEAIMERSAVLKKQDEDLRSFGFKIKK